MITLLVLQGPDKGRRFEMPDQPLVIGRESRALPLTDTTTSRRHCEMRPLDNGEWMLRDLGSSNGTYVNGTRMDRPYTLRIGDQIRVGRTLLVFGNQPGVSRSTSSHVALAGEEMGMDSSIINSLPSSEDSMVLAVPEPAAQAMSNLKILYRLSAALGSSFQIDQVLEVVMDLVFEHVKADRGIILLLNNERMLVPKVVRVREENSRGGLQGHSSSPAPGVVQLEPKAAEVEKIHASRTIIKHVLDSGAGVLSSNAMVDPRFSKGKSVHNLGIRSALCVPIRSRRLDARVDAPGGAEETVGIIYIDSSVKNYTYSTDQLRLLTAIGLQAGLAIQNAKLYQAGLEAERLAAIGETTAALSHSIKNILQALHGGADVVQMGLRRSDLNQTGKGWRIVDRNLEKIYNLTMNLLAYSKPREPRLELVSLSKIITDCLELIANNANEKGVMALADVDKDMPAIPVDPDGIHQVLMNLLTNALDAAPLEGGLIKVNCRFDPKLSLTTIEVSDNGPGISPSMMPHLFQIFHSTKGNRGTGLGLAVAKKIIDEHEGTINVNSKSGEGTTFVVRLPLLKVPGDASLTHGPAV